MVFVFYSIAKKGVKMYSFWQSLAMLLLWWIYISQQKA